MPECPLDKLPLEWIRAFEAAGRTGSFTAAAHETGLTQAAISQRISNLEARIGTQLFLRQARGVKLTVDGEAWLPHVSNALYSLRQSAEELFGTQHKKFNVLASSSVVQLWMAPRLAAMKQDSEFQISFSSMVLQSDFHDHKGIIDVRYGDGRWPGKYRARLFQEELSPVCAPDMLPPDGKWEALPRIALSGPRLGWQEWCRETNMPATQIPLIRFDSFAGALAAAKSGVGTLMASLPLCAKELQSGSLRRLSDTVLRPKESYWITAEKSSITPKHWDLLKAIFC